MKTYEVALTQVGVAESGGPNSGIPALRYMGGDKLPWCAGFVLWCNEHSSDLRIASSNPEHYVMRRVQAMEDLLKLRGWWLATSPKFIPEPNDVIFFADRGASDASRGGRHVGVVVIVSGTKVTTVEGNYRDAVERVTHDLANPRHSARITGYARIPAAA